MNLTANLLVTTSLIYAFIIKLRFPKGTPISTLTVKVQENLFSYHSFFDGNKKNNCRNIHLGSDVFICRKLDLTSPCSLENSCLIREANHYRGSFANET